MQQRIIKTLISIPTFQNVKNEARMKEEERIMMLVEKFSEPNGFVVDFGCGTSYYTGSNASGLDLDKEMLKKADLENKLLAHYSYVPLRNESFSMVVMCHSLEHINTPNQPLKEAYRILKKNGVIVISVPNLRSLQAIWNLLFHGILQGVGIDHQDHLTAFTPKLLKRLLRECGFKPILESGDVVYFPLMKRLKLMRLGFWLAKHFPKWANVYILVGEKHEEGY